jgi:type II secretory pathway pseudopilin PulG
MIAMSIFAVMSVMIMSVYINTTNTARKLNATRHLTETARQITERLAQDVRERGLSLSGSKVPSSTDDSWNDMQYTQSGGAILGIGTEDSIKLQYIYGKRSDIWLDPCTISDKNDSKTHCGLYLVNMGDLNPYTNSYNLVDSFIPEESRKRVKVQDLKFYISGWEFTTKKVTLVMTLTLMPRIGVPASMVENTKLHIQTTISERGWKN